MLSRRASSVALSAPRTRTHGARVSDRARARTHARDTPAVKPRSGCKRQARSRRAPIAVLVWLTTPKSDARSDPFDSERSSSRFETVAWSSRSCDSSARYATRSDFGTNSVACRSSMYLSSAHAAAMHRYLLFASCMIGAPVGSASCSSICRPARSCRWLARSTSSRDRIARVPMTSSKYLRATATSVACGNARSSASCSVPPTTLLGSRICARSRTLSEGLQASTRVCAPRRGRAAAPSTACSRTSACRRTGTARPRAGRARSLQSQPASAHD